MKPSENHKSKGQILIIVALMMIGLLAFLALILDGGNLYTQRREAQVAADAGALAGARTYCLTENTTLARASARDYALNKNGAQTANVIILPITGDVTVDTTITFDTFFLGVLGQEQMTASASATAACAPPTVGQGVMPVAWSCRPPVGDSDSDDCELHLMDPPPNPSPDECVYGDDPIYVIADSQTIEEDILCDTSQAGTCEGDVCYVNCDIDGDGVDDLEPLSGGNRSWLDLDGGGGGNLADWVTDGFEDPVYIHTWYGGKTGVDTSVYIATKTLEGKEVVVPVFDDFCPAQFDPPGPLNTDCTWHAGQDTTIGETGGVDYFHVISFGLFRISCVDKGGSGSCPAHQFLFPDVPLKNIPTIEGCFVEGFDASLGGGDGTVDIGAEIIYLKR